MCALRVSPCVSPRRTPRVNEPPAELPSVTGIEINKQALGAISRSVNICSTVSRLERESERASEIPLTTTRCRRLRRRLRLLPSAVVSLRCVPAPSSRATHPLPPPVNARGLRVVAAGKRGETNGARRGRVNGNVNATFTFTCLPSNSNISCSLSVRFFVCESLRCAMVSRHATFAEKEREKERISFLPVSAYLSFHQIIIPFFFFFVPATSNRCRVIFELPGMKIEGGRSTRRRRRRSRTLGKSFMENSKFFISVFALDCGKFG